MNVICFASEKGGSGKTTCAVNLGAALAKSGKKILLLDMDSQGSLTHHLSQECDGVGGNIVDLWEGRISLKTAITECKSQVHFIASTRQLSEYGNQDFRAKLTKILAEERKIYDYVFLDFPPMLSDFTVGLLSVADQVIVPVEGRGGLSIRGLHAQIETVNLVQERLNARLKISGIIVSRLVERMKLCQEIVQYLAANHREVAYQTAIRESIKIAEAASVGKSIFSYSPRSAPAKDFVALAEEFLKRQEEKNPPKARLRRRNSP